MEDERFFFQSSSRKTRGKFFFAFPVLFLFFGFVVMIALAQVIGNDPRDNGTAAVSSTPAVIAEPMVAASSSIAHIPMPREVRGIYWTSWTAGSSRASTLSSYINSSQLNAVVIDVKLDNGTLAFIPRDPALQDLAPSHPIIRDIDGLLHSLQERKIYRIARIAVMRDGAFAKLHPDAALRNPSGGFWLDKTGAPWLDPASTKVSDYAVALAREVYARGFDEIQFDYVRFASDGHLSAIRYPVYDGTEGKTVAMKRFFERVGGVLRAESIPVSFDVFGLTFWSDDGVGIGQRLPDVYAVADVVSPMVYPSHYARGFQGFANPALYPYEVVKRSLDQGVELLRQQDAGIDATAARMKFRPWIQEFHLGATYDVSKVKAQIQAARDAGASGWLIWNPRNVYAPMNYADR